jgi:uncharacterized protein (TIGR03435 family)
VRYVLVVISALSVPLAAQTLPSAPRFDVASIKRNTTGLPASPPRSGKGRVTLTDTPVLLLLARAYPRLSVPADIVGLPAWAQTARFDVAVRFDPNATADQLEMMWRSLLADRMKLSAHYETRNKRGYRLVRARKDGRLGPGLTVSSLNCPPLDPAKPASPAPPEVLAATSPRGTMTPQKEKVIMSQCRLVTNAGSTMYGSGIEASSIARALVGQLQQPVDDRTGLSGMYSFKLTFSRQGTGRGGPAVETAPDGLPSLSTALQEQLGLKLERAMVPFQVIVISHIERPSDN